MEIKLKITKKTMVKNSVSTVAKHGRDQYLTKLKIILTCTFIRKNKET